MKKIYLLSAIALSSTFLSAQVIESDNYNSYTVGNVGTSTTFGAPGQGGIYTSGGANTDYQIVDIDVTHGKSIQFIGGATATAVSNRQAVKLGFGAAWAARTAGNDILRATFDFYTGTSTGTNLPGINITNASGGLVGLKYNTATKLFQGMANLTVSGTPGFYNITGISAVQYPANTWVKVGFTYDKVNGVITYTIGGVTSTLVVDGATVTKNLDGTQFNLLHNFNTGNTAATTSAFDNYVVDAVSAATLGVSTVGQIEKTSNVTIYPNPTADFISIKSLSRVISFNIVDLSGKAVSSAKAADNKIDVRNLTKGTYIINIETENGTETKKFIKK